MTMHLAIDLGAESGRVVVGEVTSSAISLREIHRFPTRPIRMQGHWRWNVYRIFEEILEGLVQCARIGARPLSVGVDTWGVDFGLIAADGSLLGLPVAYRDERTEGMMERFFERMPRETVYAKTGVQFMRLNSLYQLFAVAQNEPALLDATRGVLFMPDLFHYFLCGAHATEFTFATTTQMYNVHRREWDGEICSAIGLDPALLPTIVGTGSEFGPLSEDIRETTQLEGCRVVAPATHDTASAVAAIPAQGEDWAFISSGTWSLVGMETAEPNCSAEALRHNFTNEGGVAGTFRFLKNIMGLWIVQRCRDDFDAELSYDDLLAAAAAAPAFSTLIDPDAEDFYHPASMTAAIDAYCARRGTRPPASPGAYVRCALESLALRYRQVIEELQSVLGRDIRRVHVVGGGAQNALLCQWTADAAGIPVYAGPVEATALGNVIAQAVSAGSIASFAEARRVVSESLTPLRYEPRDLRAWDGAYARFIEIAS